MTPTEAMEAKAATTPTLIRRSELLANGYSDNRIRSDRRHGLLAVIAPGIYLPLPLAQEMTAAARHRAAVDALLCRLSGNPVVSHLSAAILHDLPVAGVAMLPIHVIRSGSSKSRPGPSVYAHGARIGPTEVVMLGDLRTTSVARTVVDCALLLPLDEAVLLARAALQQNSVTAAELTGQLSRQARVPGARRVAAVLARAGATS